MKKWYQSKTIWYAIVTAMAGIFTALATAYPDVGFLVLANSALVLALRLISTSQIGTPVTDPTASQ